MRELGSEINRIASDTSFGGTNLLDGTYNAEFQVGADSGQVISMTMTSIMSADGTATSVVSFSLSDIATSASAISGQGTGVATAFATATGLTFTSTDKAQSVLATVDAMIGAIDAKRAQLGAVQNRFQSTIRNQSNISENLQAARSRVQDADFASETARLTRSQILQQASTSILAQANQRPQSALALIG
jgi:flagellin